MKRQTLIRTLGTQAVRYYELSRDARSNAGDIWPRGTRCTAPQVISSQLGDVVCTYVIVPEGALRVCFRLGGAI